MKIAHVGCDLEQFLVDRFIFTSGFIRFLVSAQKAVVGQTDVTLCLSFCLLPHLIVFQSRERVFKYRLSDESSENTGVHKNKGIN